MKLRNGILTIALAICSGPCIAAQTAAPASKASPNAIQPAPKSYRLAWTITDMDTGKTVGTQHFSMVLVPGGKTTMKLGSKVPVATGSYSGSANAAAVQTQFQYLDVGLNIQATLEETAAGMKLYSMVEQSSVTEERLIGEIHEPVVRQAVLQGTSIVTMNRPVILGSLDVPGSTRHLDIEVVLENVK